MYLIYVDDSGRSHRNSGNGYFCLSAIIVNERNWADIDNKIEALKKRYGINEIHIRDIDKMDDEFTYLLKNPFLRQQILGDIYSLISQIDVVLISCIIDKSKYFGQYIEDDSKYISFTFLVERLEGCIDSLCQNRDSEFREFGLIIIDNTTAEDDTRTYSKYIRKFGTTQQKITKIIEEPLFTPSHWRTFTQLADAVAYCSTHHLSKDPLFTTNFLIIQDKFYKNKNGLIEGYGWKLFPP